MKAFALQLTTHNTVIDFKVLYNTLTLTYTLEKNKNWLFLHLKVQQDFKTPRKVAAIKSGSKNSTTVEVW